MREEIFLYGLNAVAVVFGLVLLIYGVLERANDPDDWVYLVAIGVYSVACGVMGFWTTYNKSRRLLVTYFITGIVLSTILLIFGIVGIVTNQDVDDDCTHSKKDYDNYYTDPVSKKKVDCVQEKHACCGFNGPEDYKNSTLPESCCKDSKPCKSSSEDLHSKGCDSRISLVMVMPGICTALGLILGISAIVEWKRSNIIRGEQAS